MVPVEVPTSRLVLRPPRLDDAPAIFARYASVPDVTKFLAWRRHDSVEETRAFVKFSETEWRSRGCGPYLIWSRAGETLLARNERTPTLILFGPSDHVLYPDFDRMAALVFPQHVGPFLLRDCGHFVPWEAPHAFTSAVVAFAGRRG